jgi:hypothetical protein
MPRHGSNQTLDDAARRIPKHECGQSGGPVHANGRQFLMLRSVGVIDLLGATSKLTPGRKTLSRNPFKIAGKPSFHTG